MKYTLIPILLFALACKGIQAQTIMSANIKTSLEDSAIILPKLDNKALLIKELTNRESGDIVTFAEAINTNIDVNNHGIWDNSRSSVDIWRLKIKSLGALSINFGFEQFYLPEGTQLFIYNEDQSYSIGPFTEEDNDDHKQLWTPIIKDDVLIIELIIPKAKKNELVLELTKVNHDFLGFGRSFSGSCNLDVICGENDGFEMVENYRDIIKSVGAFHINGTSTCSGVLLNNTREDKTPFFLTADHCGISENNSPSVVAYWNYENSYCRQPDSFESGSDGDGNLSQFNTGVIYRAGSNASDFTLVEFDDPIKAEYKPFFAGWKNDFESTPIVIGIHHPGVEEKRISFEFDEVVNSTGNFIDVNDWDIGTTEGGSSGSPIFDENKKVIGQLRGGLAACSNDLSDNYGSINASWLGDGTPDGSLRPWLDPDNTGLTEIDGFNGAFGLSLASNNFEICTKDINELVIAFEVEASFTDFVNIEVQNLPQGLSIASLDQNLTPGENSELVIQNLNALATGVYEIVLVSTDGENFGENNISLQTSQDNPEEIVLVEPMNEIDDAQVAQEFMWQATPTANSYDFEISYDENFTNIFTSVNEIRDSKFVVSDLDNLTQFYWRVRAINYCGQGNWSETFSFRTSQSYCLLVSSKDVPIPISESGTSENISSIFVDYPLLIDNIKIPKLTIEHSYLEDLIITLVNPENTEEVLIMTTECGSNENIDAGFADDGLDNIPCPPIDGNIYQPVTPFRDFVGINAQGKWDLKVLDTYNFDGGEISSWNMELCFSKTEEAAIIPLDGELANICLGEDNRLRFYYNLAAGTTEDVIMLETANGESIPFNYQGTYPLTGSGEIVLNLEGMDPLVEGLNELYIILGSGLETRVLVNVSEGPEISSIAGISNGETVASLENISWTAENSETFTIYIAEDVEFTEIVWSTTLDGSVSSIEGPELEDGEYFMVIEATGICGTISSELYNFMIDESVSIIESNLPTLFVGQNVSNNDIILSGNSTRQEYQINIISVSGHKLLSQDFREETLHLDVNALVPGVYFLQIKSGIDSTIRKIVIY